MPPAPRQVDSNRADCADILAAADAVRRPHVAPLEIGATLAATVGQMGSGIVDDQQQKDRRNRSGAADELYLLVGPALPDWFDFCCHPFEAAVDLVWPAC